jgi:hypothetical protein
MEYLRVLMNAFLRHIRNDPGGRGRNEELERIRKEQARLIRVHQRQERETEELERRVQKLMTQVTIFHDG